MNGFNTSKYYIRRKRIFYSKGIRKCQKCHSAPNAALYLTEELKWDLIHLFINECINKYIIFQFYISKWLLGFLVITVIVQFISEICKKINVTNSIVS